MTAETFYKKHFNTNKPPSGCDVLERDYTYRDLLNFAKAYSKAVKYPEEYEEFKYSQRAYKLSLIIDLNFEVELLPKIKRRYRNNEEIKFEMHTASSKVYFFKGLVQDFLSKEAVIKKEGQSFILEDF
jgi:hypothetical protein